MCSFFCLRWASVFLISRQRSSCYPIVSVGFCKACLFFKNVLCLQLHYFFHFPTICVLRTWNHQCFVLNLVITDSLTICFPPFLLLSGIKPCLSMFPFFFFFNVYQNCWQAFASLETKDRQRRKRGVIVALKGITMCVDTCWCVPPPLL